MKEYVGIYIKTEKAQEQDGFGNKMKYHFHITTVHKYSFFVFCLYSSCVYHKYHKAYAPHVTLDIRLVVNPI